MPSAFRLTAPGGPAASGRYGTMHEQIRERYGPAFSAKKEEIERISNRPAAPAGRKLFERLHGFRALMRREGEEGIKGATSSNCGYCGQEIKEAAH